MERHSRPRVRPGVISRLGAGPTGAGLPGAVLAGAIVLLGTSTAWASDRWTPRDFPASVWADQRCSATLIGDRVLLTAAHCFKSDMTARIRFGQAVYDGVCDTAVKFTRGRVKADVALCLLRAPVPLNRFERISLAPDAVRVRQCLLLTGFGRRNRVKAGALIIGDSVVVSVDNGEVETSGGLLTTSGDSGGAGYRVADGRRVIVGINVRVARETNTSYAALLSASADFITSWLAAKTKAETRTDDRVWICGLNGPAARCQP